MVAASFCLGGISNTRRLGQGSDNRTPSIIAVGFGVAIGLALFTVWSMIR
jgi:hypothetical protein